jgi:hypothetical protein
LVKIRSAKQTDLDSVLILLENPVEELSCRELGGGGPEKVVDDEQAMNHESVCNQSVVELQTAVSRGVLPIPVAVDDGHTHVGHRTAGLKNLLIDASPGFG